MSETISMEKKMTYSMSTSHDFIPWDRPGDQIPVKRGRKREWTFMIRGKWGFDFEGNQKSE